MVSDSNFVLSFQRDDPLNTVLTAPDGTPLYRVKTPIAGNVTTVKRIVYGRVPGHTDERVIAVVHRKAFSTNTIEFHGKTTPLKQWLPEPSAFSWHKTRPFLYEKTNVQYKWKKEKNGYHLYDPNSRVVAFFDISHFGVFSSGSHTAALSIAYPEAEDFDMVDAIIVSFLIAEQDRRREATTGIVTQEIITNQL